MSTMFSSSSAPSSSATYEATSASSISKGWRHNRILKRLVPWICVGMTVYVISAVVQWSEERLANEAFVTGYFLIAIIASLFSLSARKKWISRPLGRVAIWQSAHHYLGLLCVCVYAMHAGLLLGGWIEIALGITFWIVCSSGLISWYVNRSSPRFLRAAGNHILREDIPECKREIAERAYRLALEAAGRNDTAALADYYRTELSRFFMQPRSLLFRLLPTGTRRRRLLASLENLDRYLSDLGKESRRRMSELVIAKDNVDFQHAIQVRIRVWAYLHTLFLGSFLILTSVHVYLAFRFSSHW